MKTRRTINLVRICILIILLLTCSQAIAANYPLEIIQPRSGLDTKNRFYKAEDQEIDKSTFGLPKEEDKKKISVVQAAPG